MNARFLPTLFLLTSLFISNAFAQTQSLSTDSNREGSGGVSSGSVGPLKAKPWIPGLLLGLKSYNASARFEYRNDDATGPNKGQIYNGKQEAFLGYKAGNSWGAYGQFTQYRLQYNDSALNKWSLSDPSLSILHPDLFNNGIVKISGLARAYVPITDRSKRLGIRQFAYYSNLNYDVGNGHEISHQSVPRFFAADTYGDADTRFVLEDRLTYSYKIGKWGRAGVSNWFQFEQHAATKPGYTSEVIPQFDYMISPSMFIGPRVYLPIFAQNKVYDGPSNATFEQSKVELYLQATL
ncbi:MAG: hypothetical protein EOP06_15335 [Proteobacteria bacterium]|nr:MAG: hypothetical protein EOP06_15335 [Pseudomonadota bacterium]